MKLFLEIFFSREFGLKNFGLKSLLTDFLKLILLLILICLKEFKEFKS